MPTEQAINYWPQNACARAYWGQQELPSYRRLLADTAAWLDPKPGHRWLDLGCGCGQLSSTLWHKSEGTLAEIIGLDVAASNAKAFDDLRVKLTPAPGERFRFLQGDFSSGLSQFSDATFDGIVSGLAIQYAEDYSAEQQCWTTDAYDHVLREACRILRPGGTFVFSVNVPDPSWMSITVDSFTGLFQTRKPLRYLKRGFRMWHYARWLTSEARRGRFHYLPIETIVKKLTAAGLTEIDHRLTYARQAFLVRCRRPIV